MSEGPLATDRVSATWRDAQVFGLVPWHLYGAMRVKPSFLGPISLFDRWGRHLLVPTWTAPSQLRAVTVKGGRTAIAERLSP
jgi:hypothetical protein